MYVVSDGGGGGGGVGAEWGWRGGEGEGEGGARCQRCMHSSKKKKCFKHLIHNMSPLPQTKISA